MNIKLFMATVFLMGISAFGHADSITHLERERAALISALLNPHMDSGHQQAKIDTATARLQDLERMVIRDDKLAASNTLAARQMFKNYDLSFLVLASAEHNRHPLDHWLTAVGLSTQSILAAQGGYR